MKASLRVSPLSQSILQHPFAAQLPGRSEFYLERMLSIGSETSGSKQDNAAPELM